MIIWFKWKTEIGNLIIKQKLEDTIEYAYGVFRHFPKSEKFTLVADLKRSLTKMLELIIRANKSKNKFIILMDLDTELEVFRALVRLSFELKFISIKKYEVLSQKVNEFGRLLGGWIKQNKKIY